MPITPITKVLYRTSDGTEFIYEKEALQHERKYLLRTLVTDKAWSGMCRSDVAQFLFDNAEELSAIYAATKE